MWAASLLCFSSGLLQSATEAAPPEASQPQQEVQAAAAAEAKPQPVPAKPSTGQWLWPRGDAQCTGAITNTLPADLQVAWEFTADEAIEGEPIVTADAVFVADVFGKAYALSRKDGTLLWKKDYETGFLAAPMVHKGKLIIGDVDGQVYALDVRDGKELWKHSTAGEISGSAAVYEAKMASSTAWTSKPASNAGSTRLKIRFNVRRRFPATAPSSAVAMHASISLI